MLESEIVRNCAATLAGIKTGSLFNYRFACKEQLRDELSELNESLNRKGVFAAELIRRDGHALIYLYRASSLQRDLGPERVRRLLREYGYVCFSVEGVLTRLKERLAEGNCFPHEIGVFLGYPFEDVVGFIQNKGRDCKCCGLWKVYCNEGGTRALFEKIQKCSRIYSKIFAEGRSIIQMTVSA